MDQPVQRMDGLAVVRTSGPAFNHVHIPSAATARPQGLNNAVEASFAACRLSGEGGKVPASTSMGVAPIIFAAKPDEGEMRRSSQQVTTFLALWNADSCSRRVMTRGAPQAVTVASHSSSALMSLKKGNTRK